MKKEVITHFKKYFWRYCFVLLVLIFVALNLVWLQKDTMPTRWDESWNLLVSNYYYQSFIGAEDLSQEEMFSIYPIFFHGVKSYPPLFRISSIPLYLLFGFSEDVAVATNMIYYIFIMALMYFFVRKILDEKTAFFSCFILSTMPLFFGLTVHYLLDIALLSLLFAGFFFYLKSDNFKNAKYSILFGIFFGLGTITKNFYPFLLGPTILFMFLFSKLNKKDLKKQIKNLLKVVTAFLVVAGPWIFMNIQQIIYYLTTYSSVAVGQMEGDPSWKTLRGITFYLVNINNGLSFYYFFLFFLSLILIIHSWKKLKHNEKYIFSGIFFFMITNYILFTYIANKDIRMGLIYYPFIAFIIGFGIYKVDLNKKIKNILIILILLIGSFQFIGYLTPENFPEKEPSFYGAKFYTDNLFYMRPPKGENWNITKILFDVIDDSGQNRVVTLGLIPDVNYLNYINLQHYAYKNDIQNIRIGRTTAVDLRKDYVIVTPNKGYSELEASNAYILFKEYKFPGENNFFLYKKNNSLLK